MARTWMRLLDIELHDLQAQAGSDFGSRLQWARTLNARSRHCEAAEILDQLLLEDRAHGEVWFERLLCEGDHATQEDLDNLHDRLEAVRDEHPGEAVHLRNLGYLRLLMHRPDAAERSLHRALQTSSDDAKTLELMGLLCLNRDQAAEAKGWLLKALSLQPKDPRTLRLLAITCQQLGDLQGAEAQAAAALDVDPHYYWGWHTLGELLFMMNQPQDGLRCIHRARSLQVAESSSYFIMANLLGDMGHLELAQAELHTLILLAPPAAILAEAQAMLGEIRRGLGDKDGAQSYFFLATETDPDASNPWASLGDMAREEGRVEEALRCYREALARDTDAADVQVQLGYTLLDAGMPEEAEQAFNGALESDPSEFSAYLGLSECYRKAHRYEDQTRMVREAMALAPEDPDVWNAKGVALEVQGRLDEATSAYEKALELDPSNRKAANNLGFLLEKRMKQGEEDLHERALEAWKRRLLICRDEGQSLRMAKEHLTRLGVEEDTILRWLNYEQTLQARN